MNEFTFIEETSSEAINDIIATLEEERTIPGDYGPQYRLPGWKDILVGGAFCFLAFSPSQSQGSQQYRRAELNLECSIECNFEMVEEYSAFITEIEDDIRQVQSLMTANLDDYIDGSEIREEMDIIDEYMGNVREFYKYRRRTVRL